MHIVYVCREYPPSLRSGGIASYIKEMAVSLVMLGHQVTVVTAHDDTRLSSDSKENGVRIIRLSGGNFIISKYEKNYPWRHIRGLYRYHSYCRKVRECINQLPTPDVIEVAEFGAESKFLHKLDVPVIIRLHAATLIWQSCINGNRGINFKNARHYYMDLQELKEIKRARYITSCSIALKNMIMDWLDIEDSRIKVIYNPVNIRQWINCNHKITDKKNEFLILQPGTITNVKGCEDLIKACITLKKKTDWALSLKLVGKNSSFADHLRDIYKEYDWIQISGGIPRDELKHLYEIADVVCVSSWWENMPMVCIEACYCGCIVIGSKNGGISEIIEDGENGFLMVPKRPDLLALQLEKVLMMSTDDKRKISQNATKKIKQHFSSKIIINQMIDYYKWVVEDFKKGKL